MQTLHVPSIELPLPRLLQGLAWGLSGLALVIGFATLASDGLPGLAFSCLLGILARICQAEAHHLDRLPPPETTTSDRSA